MPRLALELAAPLLFYDLVVALTHPAARTSPLAKTCMPDFSFDASAPAAGLHGALDHDPALPPQGKH